MENASRAASTVALMDVTVFRSCTPIVSVFTEFALMYIGVSVYSCAFSFVVRIRDAAPSHMGAQSIRVMGSATMGELSTLSSDISLLNIAYLFFTACLWEFTGNEHMSSRLTL